jgi:hypothetical protein
MDSFMKLFAPASLLFLASTVVYAADEPVDT